MAQAAGIEEGRGVRLLLGLRPLDLLADEAVVPDAVGVEEGVGGGVGEAADRRQEEAAVDVRVEQRCVQARAEDLGVLGLEDGRLAAELALVPGGGQGAGGAGVAPLLLLGVVAAEQRQRVGRRDLGVELGVPGRQLGLVGQAVRRQGARQRLHADVLLAVGAPGPDVVLEDRAADLAAPVVHLVDLVAEAVAELRLPGAGDRVGGQVALVEAGVRLRAAGSLQVAGRAAVLVGAALGHQVEHDAAGGDGGVRAAGRDLHLLEGAEVEVRRGGAGRCHVGDHHAVHRPDRVELERAGAGVGRLLAALVAADVDAVDEHARSRLQDRPGVARGRNPRQVILTDVGAGVELSLVEQRVADDEHLFRERRDHDHVDVGVVADADHEARIFARREALQLCLQVVDRGSEIQEPELALGIGDLNLRRFAGVQGDGDAGQRGLALIGDLAVKIAGLQLGERGTRAERQQRRGDGCASPPSIVAFHR